MALLPEGRVREATGSSQSFSWKDLGVGLYPSGAMFNHSCAPNCLWFVDRGVLVVETICSIPKGAELTIPYLPVSRRTDAKAERRRHRLQKQFGFLCLCRRCISETRLASSSASCVRK